METAWPDRVAPRSEKIVVGGPNATFDTQGSAVASCTLVFAMVRDMPAAIDEVVGSLSDVECPADTQESLTQL